ncbi:SDR family oxidoreductase [bacterium]|nr:SDR family oxidoreductase [bacterium]
MAEKYNFLVTGGAGFIGSNIAEELVCEGHHVRVVDNFITGKRENLSDFINKIELIEEDLRDLKSVKSAVKDTDFVIHQAALPSVPRSVADPLLSNECNVTATLNLLVAAREEGIKRFVYASSSSVYGDTPKLPKVESMCTGPFSPYAVSKLAGENYCKVFSHVYGLETVALRYFNVFGPRQDPESQYAAVIPLFLSRILMDKEVTVYGDGEQTRDFSYVKNVVNANLQACFADKKVSGKVFNIACGKRISLNNLIEILKNLTSKKINASYIQPRIGDIKHSLADINEAKKFLKYEPKTSVEEGLKIYIEWFKKQN